MHREAFTHRYHRTSSGVILGSGSRTLVALHGMGESAASFADSLDAIAAEGHWTIVVPDGFYAFERRRHPAVGYAWYLFAQDQALLRRTMLESSRILIDLIAGLRLEARISRGPVGLLGFSQGGYLASVAGAHFPELVSDVVCMGGRLKYEFFPDESSTLRASPRFLQMHGSLDHSVPSELGEAAVDATRVLGYSATYHEVAEVGHEVNSAMLKTASRWLRVEALEENGE